MTYGLPSLPKTTPLGNFFGGVEEWSLDLSLSSTCSVRVSVMAIALLLGYRDIIVAVGEVISR